MKKMEFGAYLLTFEIFFLFYKIEKIVAFNEVFQNDQPTWWNSKAIVVFFTIQK
jgi:hypothetical protein